MEVMQTDVRVKDFPQFIETLIDQFNSERFRVGFIKKDGSKRVGKFDLIYRVRWKQTNDTMYKRKGKQRTTDEDEYLFLRFIKVFFFSAIILSSMLAI